MSSKTPLIALGLTLGCFAAVAAVLSAQDAPRPTLDIDRSRPAKTTTSEGDTTPGVLQEATRSEAPSRPQLESWSGSFEPQEVALPAEIVSSGIRIFDRLGPKATEKIRQHLERNYIGTLEWIEKNRGRESNPRQARKEAIELARDQAKLEYFERGLYWLVESQPNAQIPATGLFRRDGHDVTFVRGVLDDDGQYKFVITYVSRQHPLMAEALRH